MKYTALICARGGSKGIPGKNIKPLNGIPLIGWSIKIAKQIDRISRVIVSTDSDEIASVAIEYGAEVPFIRPQELAMDDSPERLVWRHAIDYLYDNNYDLDGLVVLPTTAPLRNIIDVNNCIDEFEKGDVDTIITVSNAHRNPYFNMVTVDNDNYSSLVIPPQNKVDRRQVAPKVFDMTTVAYVVRPQSIYEHHSIFSGRVRSVHVPPERALDIDTPLDFMIAECFFYKKIR
jgi:N-acylneuraminate cytidylyltransferase